MKALLLSGLIVVTFAGGACARSAPPDTGVIAEGSTTASASEQSGDGEPRASEAGHGIPPGYLPPPGQCRIWMPDEPAEEQAREYPVGRCSTLRQRIPAGGWLVYRPTDDSGVVRVWQYGEAGQVLHQRIYDVETGELLRHVGPMGN